MVLTFDEMKEFEELKQENKKEILRLTNANEKNKHQWRMCQLEKEHELYKDCTEEVGT